MKLSKRGVGQAFELRARNYIEEQGFEVIDQNVTFRFGEIDLIAQKNRTLTFFEVRKRALSPLVSAEDTITFKKQMCLRMAIETYLARYRGQATSVSIDLIAFQGDQIRHYPNFMTVS